METQTLWKSGVAVRHTSVPPAQLLTRIYPSTEEPGAPPITEPFPIKLSFGSGAQLRRSQGSLVKVFVEREKDGLYPFTPDWTLRTVSNSSALISPVLAVRVIGAVGHFFSNNGYGFID